MDYNLDWIGDEEAKELIGRYMEANEAGFQPFFDVDEFELIIDYFLDGNKIDEAGMAIEMALDQHPASTGFSIRNARYLGLNKQFYEALELLNNIGLIEIANVDVFLNKAEIYSLMNKHEMAIEEYKKALDFAEDKEEIYSSISYEYENNGDYKNAIKYLKLALNENPESETLLHELSFFYEITGMEEDAVEFFNEYVDKYPYSKLAWFNLGVFYNTLELFEKAIEAYEFVLAIDENFASAYFNIANSYSGLKYYRKAINYYRETFKYEDEDALTHIYIGESYENLEEYQNALLHYNSALNIDANSADAWVGLARLAITDEEDAKAINFYKRAVEINPHNEDIAYDLGLVYFRIGEWEKAKDIFTNIIENDDTYVDAWLALSRCFAADGDMVTAIAKVEKALETLSDNAFLWYRLAAYLYESGKVQQAYYYIEVAMKIDYDAHSELLEYNPGLLLDPRFSELLYIYKNP